MFRGLHMPRCLAAVRPRMLGTDPAFAAWRSITGSPAACSSTVASEGRAGPAAALGRYDSDEVEAGLDEFWQRTGLNAPFAGDSYRPAGISPTRLTSPAWTLQTSTDRPPSRPSIPPHPSQPAPAPTHPLLLPALPCRCKQSCRGWELHDDAAAT